MLIHIPVILTGLKASLRALFVKQYVFIHSFAAMLMFTAAHFIWQDLKQFQMAADRRAYKADAERMFAYEHKEYINI